MGPAIASVDGLDLADIDLRTTVSGELMQEANTRDLIFSIVELIVYLSAGVTLEPGDVIATGTPAGVGDSRRARRATCATATSSRSPSAASGRS